MEKINPISTDSLIKIIKGEFEKNGWQISGKKYIPPLSQTKESIRLLHKNQRFERSGRELNLVQHNKKELLSEFACGKEIDPYNFEPKLIEVKPGSWENELFRFATLFWSIPVSQGYGRRIRFLVKDLHNNKMVGIFGLMDPVFNLKVRDQFIGWNSLQREERLYNVMDAFVLGAVPPYNNLLCGKMIALSTISNEVRDIFSKKYKKTVTEIRKQEKKPYLALITTTSALGKSSIYNRIKIIGEDFPAFQSLGYSVGWGHFHVSDPTFILVRNWLRQQGCDYADGYKFGQGPNWKLRTIRKALSLLGFPQELLKHGIQREVFAAPIMKNYQQFLLGDQKKPRYFDRELRMLSSFFKERWMIPRSKRVETWKEWKIENTWQLIEKNIQSEYPFQMDLFENEKTIPLKSD